MRLLFALFCLSALSALAPARLLAGPDWWSAEGTSIWKTTPVDSENHAPVTVGQLKHVAAMARLHLQGTLASVGGEGAAIAAMVDAFTTADPENAAPANVGQLKNVAALFYDRLAQVGYAWQTGTFSTTTATTPYPWTGTVHPENAMPCNIGQLKNVFSFAVTPAFLEEDGDGDGIPSWWEMAWQFDPLMSNSDFDADLDQLSNLEEYLLTVYTGISYNPRMASTAGTTWTDYEQSLMTGGLTEQETAVLRGSDPHVLRAHPLYGSIQKGVEFWRAQQLISSAPEMPPFVANVGNSKQWLVNNGNESSFNDVPNAPVGGFGDIAAYLPEWPEDLLTSGAVPFHPGLSEMVIQAGGGTDRIADEETYTYRNLAGYMAVGQIWLKLPQPVSFPVKRTIHILRKTRYFQNAFEPVNLPPSPEDELITHVFHLPASAPPMPEAAVPFPEVPPAGPILLGAPAGAGSSVVPQGSVITDGKEIIPFQSAISQDGVGHVSTATRFRFVFSAWPPETFGKVGGTPVTTETESTVYLPVRLNENKEQDTAAASQNLTGAPAPANALPDIDRNRATVYATEFLPVETREFDRDFIVLDMDTASLPQEEVKLELIVSESSSTKVYLYDEEGRAIPPADCLSTEAQPIAPIWEKLATGQIRAEIGRLNTAAAEVPGSPPLPAPGPATLTVRATFLNPQAETAPGAPSPNIVLDKSIVLIPIEVVEVSPKTKDENGNDIVGSEKPSMGKPLTPFVELNPVADKIAHRELKVKLGDALKNKTVTWTLEPVPGTTPATIRGAWTHSTTHPNRFEASTTYGANGFTLLSQASGTTTVSNDGFTAIRVNVPPIGFNQVRIKIQVEGTTTPIDLIDMEVPGMVVIDPGHGGQDSGAVGAGGVQEKDLALAYGLSLREQLIQKFTAEKRQLQVVMTRKTTEAFPSLTDRPQRARDTGSDILVSIHFNSGAVTARGTETFVERTASEASASNPGDNKNIDEDIALATALNTTTLNAVTASDGGAVNRGVKREGKAVTRDGATYNGNTQTYHPVKACLIEVEFLSNASALETIKLTNATGLAIKEFFAENGATDIFNNIRNQQ